MIRSLVLVGLLAASQAQLPVTPKSDPQRVGWNVPTSPFRMIGNVHFVGTEQLPAYLITTPRGHFLIDGAMEESADQIVANIRALGFRIQDVRYLLNNHAHWDHSGGLAALKRASGAKMVASVAEAPTLEAGRPLDRDDLDAFPAVKVDRRIGQGERLTLGNTTLVVHLTPGHTRGCTSWSMKVRDPAVRGGKPLSVMFACSLTVAGTKLVNNPRYPQAVQDFRATFDRLEAMKADVFLNFHSEFFDLAGKRKRLEAGDRGAFVDPGELKRQVTRARAGFETELKRQQAAAR